MAANSVWWLAVDFDGTEKISTNPDGFQRFNPILYRNKDITEYHKAVCWADTQKEYPIWIEKHEYDHNKLYYERTYMELPEGSIEKLIGRKLTWEDEPIKLDNYGTEIYE